MKKGVLILVLLACSGAAQADGYAVIAWTAPTLNTDGSPLTDLTGYRLFSGADPAGVPNGIPALLGLVTNYRAENLSVGQHCFGLRAVAATGQVSDMSNIICKTVAPEPEPEPVPSNVTVSTTVMEVKQGSSGWWLSRNIGKIALGVACNGSALVNRSGPDYYEVPSDKVSFKFNLSTGGVPAARCDVVD